jgi:hypothetical protein
MPSLSTVFHSGCVHRPHAARFKFQLLMLFSPVAIFQPRFGSICVWHPPTACPLAASPPFRMNRSSRSTPLSCNMPHTRHSVPMTSGGGGGGINVSRSSGGGGGAAIPTSRAPLPFKANHAAPLIPPLLSCCVLLLRFFKPLKCALLPPPPPPPSLPLLLAC